MLKEKRKYLLEDKTIFIFFPKSECKKKSEVLVEGGKENRVFSGGGRTFNFFERVG